MTLNEGSIKRYQGAEGIEVADIHLIYILIYLQN